MKRMFAKSLAVALAVFLAAAGVTGCCTKLTILARSNPVSSTNFEIKSKGTKFQADSVILDFCYGTHNPYGYIFDSNVYDYDLVCFALYFYDGQHDSQPGYVDDSGVPRYYFYDNYRDIDNRYFIKDISPEEFSSGEYALLDGFMWQVKYKHQEFITVPGEVFERENGSFVFELDGIYYSEKENGYCLTRKGRISVNYSYIDEQTIVLSHS